MGLIEMRQGEGTFVRQFEENNLKFPLSTAMLMNKEDIMNLLEVRKVIEIGMAAIAAKKRTKENLNIMEAALNEMKTANGDEELGEKADLNFHIAIASAAQNSLLLKLFNDVSGLLQESMKETRRIWLYSRQTTVEKLYDQHLAIYNAVVEQNSEKAQEAMKAHLNNVEEILKKYYDEKKIDD